MKTLNWGLMGAGAISNEVAGAIRASKTGRAAAVASRDHHRSLEFARAHAIPTAYGDYPSLLGDPSIDVVYIATPHPLHAEWAIKAAEAGKNVLCEKPLALNHAEAMAMVDAARRSGTFLMEGFMYRMHPQIKRLMQLIRNGDIGRVRLIEATFSFGSGSRTPRRLFDHDLGGGGILDVGCYCVSIARLVAAVATGEQTTEPIEVIGIADIDPEDRVDHFALGSFRFAGRIFAHLSCGVALTQTDRLHIYGDEGYISISQPCWLSELSAHRLGGVSGIILTRRTQQRKVIRVEAPKPLFSYEIDHVAAAIEGLEQPAVTWQDSLENMRTLDRWRDAIGLTYDREQGPRGSRAARARL